MRYVTFVRYIVVALVVCVTTVQALPSGAAGLGSRVTSWFSSGSDSASTPSASATPRVATRTSEPTFERSPLAPEPSVTMPAPTPPTGNLPTAERSEKRAWGGRIWSAMNSTREALTIKPREVPAPDAVRLNSAVNEDVQAPVFVSAARVYEVQGKLREAREYYEKALSHDAKNLDAMVGLARLKHREGDLVAATEMYQRALRAHPNNPVILNDLGLCYARREMLQQAQQSIEQAVKQDGSSKLYRNNLALVLVEMNRKEAAYQQLRAVHGEAVAHYNLAFLLREKGQHDAAAEHLRAALHVDPRMEPARLMLAQLNPPANPNRGNGRFQGEQPRGQLGTPQIERQPQAPYGAPVVNRQPAGSGYQNRQRIPVSHRQPETTQPPRNERQAYPGANYGSPNQGASTNDPASVGPVSVRFENGQPSDYRRGAGGIAPQHGAPQYRQVQPQAGQGQPQQGYNPVYREAPLPDAAPDYLQRRAQPVTPQDNTGGSRWTTP